MSSLRLAVLLTAVALVAGPALAQGNPAAPPADHSQSQYGPWYHTAWQHLTDIWQLGRYDLYVPLRTYHPAYAYSLQQRESFNDFPAGGGLGKGRYNANGNWEGLCAMEFADSHGKPEYSSAYLWIPTWHPLSDQLRAGAGLAAGITARSDIGHYTPFPGVLPVASLGYRIFDVQATYVPGFKGDGNVLFCWAKLSF